MVAALVSSLKKRFDPRLGFQAVLSTDDLYLWSAEKS